MYSTIFTRVDTYRISRTGDFVLYLHRVNVRNQFFLFHNQFAPRVYTKKLVFSEVVSFLILLPIHSVVELFRCLTMLVQLIAKITLILIKGLVVWLSNVFSIALGIFFGVAIIADCLAHVRNMSPIILPSSCSKISSHDIITLTFVYL